MRLELGEHWETVSLPEKARRLPSRVGGWLAFSSGKQGSHPVGRGIKHSAGGYWTRKYQAGNGKSPGTVSFSGLILRSRYILCTSPSIHTKQVKLGRQKVVSALPSTVQLPIVNKSQEQIPEINKSLALSCVQS